MVLDLKFITERTASYYNKKHSIGPILKEGDRVYLLRKNIITKQPSSKLDYKKLGPFKIAKVKGKTNYKLALPKTINIYLVFYILLLKLAPPRALKALKTEI